MVKESASHVDSKLEAMEQRLNKKNQELFTSIKALIAGLDKPPGASYAGVTAPVQQAGHVWGPQVGARAANQVHVRLTQPGEGRQYGLRAPTVPIRSRSPGIKRVKLDNGATLEVVQDRSGVDANISKPPRNNPKKAVTGTSNANITGRKMRSPPADIFVYGVHPDTTEDDIVLDLAESGIVITASQEV